jgi:UDP-glucose 4-epimerase
MKLLVTGSRGFLGGSMGRQASRAGHTVLGIGRSSEAPANWPGQHVRADVAEDDLADIIRDFAPDAVFHAAGTASVGRSLDAPLEDFQAAVLSFANTLEGVRRSGVRPLVIYPSSAAVHGNPPSLPVAEDAPTVPISPYGYHKLACELLAREYSTCFGMEMLVCRLFSIFGPVQRRLLVWELYRQFAGAELEVWLQGTGHETRDYLHVDDLCKAVLQLWKQRACGEREGRMTVLNVASGEARSVLEVARQIGRIVAPDKAIRCRGEGRPGDPSEWRADISALRSRIQHWHPRPFDQGMTDCVSAWQHESLVGDPSNGQRPTLHLGRTVQVSAA